MSTQILNPEATSLLINAFWTNTGTALANIATGVTGPGSPTLCNMLNTFAITPNTYLLKGSSGDGTETTTQNGRSL
jgi:hypothetical protein